MTYTGNSGIGTGACGWIPVIPQILRYPGTTTREMVYLDGKTMPGDKLYVNDVLQEWYRDPEVFRVPVALTMGVNTIKLQVESILGFFSAAANLTITRVQWTEDVQKIDMSLDVGGKDMSGYVVTANAEESTPYLANRITFTLKGNFRPELHPEIDIKKEVIFTYTLNGVPMFFQGEVGNVRVYSSLDGNITTYLDCFSKGLAAVDQKLDAVWIRGFTNGKVLKEFAKTLGYAEDKILIPQGDAYVGPRSLHDKTYQEVINHLIFIQVWSIDINHEWFVVYDNADTGYKSFTLTDGKLFVSEYGKNSGNYFNVLRGQKIFMEENVTDTELALLNIPAETGEGYAFYSNLLLNKPVAEYHPESTVYIKVFSDRVNWTNLSVAKVYFYFCRLPGMAMDFNKAFPLIVVADRNFGMVAIPLDIYSLFKDSEVWIKPDVVDQDSVRYTLDEYVRVPISEDIELELRNFVTKYRLSLEPREMVGEVDTSFEVARETLPVAGLNNVQWTNYNTFGSVWELEWIVKIPFDPEDIPLATIDTDLDVASASTADPSYVHNCEIYTETNVTVNYQQWWFAVDYNNPAKPLRRCNGVYVKIRASVTPGDTIAFKFKVFGQRILLLDRYEDIENLFYKYEHPDVISGTIPAVDGGVIRTPYFSNITQIKRAVQTYAAAGVDPPANLSGDVPANFEIIKGDILKLETVQDELDYFMHIMSVAHKISLSQGSISARTSLKGYVVKTTDIPARWGVGALETVRVLKIIGIQPENWIDSLYGADYPNVLKEGIIKARRYRGGYRVEIDGVEYTGVPSLYPNLQVGDVVICGELMRKSEWVILNKKTGVPPDYDPTKSPEDATGDDYSPEDQYLRIIDMRPEDGSTVVPWDADLGGMIRWTFTFNKPVKRFIKNPEIRRKINGAKIATVYPSKVGVFTGQEVGLRWTMKLAYRYRLKFHGSEPFLLYFDTRVEAVDGSFLPEPAVFEYNVHRNYNPKYRGDPEILYFLPDEEKEVDTDLNLKLYNFTDNSVNYTFGDNTGTMDVGDTITHEDTQATLLRSPTETGYAPIYIDKASGLIVVCVLKDGSFDYETYRITVTDIDFVNSRASVQISNVSSGTVYTTQILDEGELRVYNNLEYGLTRVEQSTQTGNRACIQVRLFKDDDELNVSGITPGMNEIVIEFNQDIDVNTAIASGAFTLTKA